MPIVADPLLNKPQESPSHVLKHSGTSPKKALRTTIFLRTKEARFPM